MVFFVSASELDEVDAADAVDVLLLVSEEPVDPHAVSASAVAAATRARTLEEVGREFNVTRERIRQIEAKALRKLRHPSRSKRLKDFLI